MTKELLLWIQRITCPFCGRRGDEMHQDDCPTLP